MDITIITNITTQDLPNVQRILSDLGVATTPEDVHVVPNLSALPTPETPQATPQASGSDPAAAARAARQFYADVASALGMDRLTPEQQAYAKRLRKQGVSVSDVAHDLGGEQVDLVATPVADDDDDIETALRAFLEARKASHTPQATPQASTSGRKLTAMPQHASALSEAQRTALRAWTANFVARPRIEAVAAYVAGELPWSACEAVGVKASKALRQLNA